MLISRALVTGCAGFIGSHLTESLLQDGVEVVGVDCFNDNYGRRAKLRNLDRAHEWDSFDFVPLDLSRAAVPDLVADADVVFHLAAEPGVRASWGPRFDTYLRNNLLATQNLLESCKQWPEKQFVYASSSSIYGQAERMPTSESDLPRPFSPYGVTKLAAEHLCLSCHDNYGLQSVALRYFSVYGPRQRPDMAFTRFCFALLDDVELEVYGDGLQTRDFTFVEDVVRATRVAAESSHVVGNAYNVGGGSQIGLRTALSLLEDISGVRARVRYQSAQQGDVRSTSADTTLALAHLRFEPRVVLETGLRRQFEWAIEERARAARAFRGSASSGRPGLQRDP